MHDREVLAALSALAHQTRLRVYRLLAAAGYDGLPAGRIAAELLVAPTSLSGHLGILARAGVLSASRAGRSVVYRAHPEVVRAVADAVLPPWTPAGQAQPTAADG